MAGTEVVTVEAGSEFKDFIDLPWRIYAKYPNWVPPLKKEVRRMLDPRKHPFWEFSERILFLADVVRDVGRIAGIIDRHYNQFHDEKMGVWDSSNALTIRRPRRPSSLPWRRGSPEGDDFMRGPLNPSINYEVGLLIEGYDYPPALMMAYNPPYYQGW